MTTVETIRGRLRVKIDGTGDARVRATRLDGRPAGYSARRSSVVAVALRWRAMGFESVEVDLPARQKNGLLARSRTWRPFPATQDEAIAAVRELAAGRGLDARAWRRFLATRIDDAAPEEEVTR